MKSDQVKRIGIVGCGVIGTHIAKTAAQQRFAQVDFVYDEKLEKARLIPTSEALEKASDVATREVDLVKDSWKRVRYYPRLRFSLPRHFEIL